jgi:hypothetical protein
MWKSFAAEAATQEVYLAKDTGHGDELCIHGGGLYKRP